MSTSTSAIAGLAQSRLAVVSGAAMGGLGYAVAHILSTRYSMSPILIDINEAGLAKALNGLTDAGVQQPRSFSMDVSRVSEWERFIKWAEETEGLDLGNVGYLGLNAGIGTKSGTWIAYGAGEWEKTIGVNLMGVVYGAQAVVPKMVAGGKDGTVVVTGSKQGITCPPGNPAYNASKAAVKAFAEALEHDLRSNPESSKVHAHLLVPGWVNTNMTNPSQGPKAPGSWTPEQTIEYLLSKMEAGKFYAICPDNDVTEAMDKGRMEWTARDHILNRAPLSRWHPEYKDEFEKHMKQQMA